MGAEGHVGRKAALSRGCQARRATRPRRTERVAEAPSALWD